MKILVLGETGSGKSTLIRMLKLVDEKLMFVDSGGILDDPDFTKSDNTIMDDKYSLIIYIIKGSKLTRRTSDLMLNIQLVSNDIPIICLNNHYVRVDEVEIFVNEHKINYIQYHFKFPDEVDTNIDQARMILEILYMSLLEQPKQLSLGSDETKTLSRLKTGILHERSTKYYQMKFSCLKQFSFINQIKQYFNGMISDEKLVRSHSHRILLLLETLDKVTSQNSIDYIVDDFKVDYELLIESKELFRTLSKLGMTKNTQIKQLNIFSEALTRIDVLLSL